MKKGIGEFEELVLLCICVLDDKAYSISIKEEIFQRTNRRVSLSAVQTTLYRMEDKGLVNSFFGESTSVRGGKRKKYFRITALAARHLQELRDMRNMLWKDIPQFTFE